MPSYKLWYFPARGRAECIRMLFALNEVPFEEVIVPMVEWSEFKDLTPFHGLPVLEVDDRTKIGQTVAILRYIADQYGYGGDTPIEKALVTSTALASADFMVAFTPWHVVNAGLAPGDKVELYISNYLPAREKYFPLFKKMLNENPSGWLVGDSITFADLSFATCLEMLDAQVPDKDALFNGYPQLKMYMESVLSHPKLKRYIETRNMYKY